MVCLTQLNAHKQKLAFKNRETLEDLTQHLHPQVFAHPSFKNIYTIANRFAYEPQPLKTFEARKTWEDVALFLSRLPKREQVAATQWIDNFDQYFDNQPQLLIKVQASLAQYLLRQESATSLIHTSLSIRSVTRDYWLRSTGSDLAASPAYHDARDDKFDLALLLQHTIDENTSDSVRFEPLVETTQIYVPQRDQEEDFTEYVLRHTFLTRSSVKRMALSLAHAREGLRKPLTAETVRRLVNERAYENAQMELHQTASDLRALVHPNYEPPPQETTISIIKDMLRDLSSELTTWDAIQDRISRLPDILVPYMVETLWRHRLILKSPVAEDEAYCSGSTTDRLESGTPRLRLHSALLEYCGVAPEKGSFRIGFL